MKTRCARRPRTASLAATAALLISASLSIHPAHAAPAATAVPPDGRAATMLLQKSGCTGCHHLEDKRVGPAFKAVAQKYAERSDAVTYLTGKIRAGGAGVWGPVPMPAQGIAEPDARAIAEWLAAGAPK